LTPLPPDLLTLEPAALKRTLFGHLAELGLVGKSKQNQIHGFSSVPEAFVLIVLTGRSELALGTALKELAALLVRASAFLWTSACLFKPTLQRHVILFMAVSFDWHCTGPTGATYKIQRSHPGAEYDWMVTQVRAHFSLSRHQGSKNVAQVTDALKIPSLAAEILIASAVNRLLRLKDKIAERLQADGQDCSALTGVDKAKALQMLFHYVDCASALSLSL
jgi:hypothetical protein